MIVSAKHRYCYLTAPKTASKSLRQLFMTRFGGVTRGAFHQNLFVKPSPGWFVFGVVRNPYARLVSWWWFTARSRLKKQPKAERDYWEGKGLADFIRYITKAMSGDDIPNRDQREMRFPQHRFFEKSQIDRFLYFERLLDAVNG